MMKVKSMLVGFAVIASLGLLSANAAPPPAGALKVTSVKAVPDTLKSGDEFSVELNFDTGEKALLAGLSVYAYGKDIPEGCGNLGWELKKAKNPKWDVWQIVKHAWLKDKLGGEKRTFTRKFDTKGWPSGDYNIFMNLTVLVDGKDYYQPCSFAVSIE